MYDAIVLAGGLGTRLREVVADEPKVLAQVSGRPFLDILLSQLDKSGIMRRVILAIGYKADQIVEYYETHPFSFELLFSEEKEALGTGGAMKQALSLAQGEHIFALNGDSYFALSFSEMAAQHRGLFSLACRQVPDVSRYGSVSFDQSNRIFAFNEKAAKEGKGWINGGIYFFSPEIFRYFPDRFSLECDALPQLLDMGVYAYPSEGQFIDIGTKETYNLAQELFT